MKNAQSISSMQIEVSKDAFDLTGTPNRTTIKCDPLLLGILPKLGDNADNRVKENTYLFIQKLTNDHSKAAVMEILAGTDNTIVLPDSKNGTSGSISGTIIKATGSGATFTNIGLISTDTARNYCDNTKFLITRF